MFAKRAVNGYDRPSAYQRFYVKRQTKMTMLMDTTPLLHLDDPIYLVGLIACVLIPAVSDVFAFIVFRRASVRVALVASEIVFLAGYLFGIDPLIWFSAIAIVVTLLFGLVMSNPDFSRLGPTGGKISSKGKGFLWWKKDHRKQGESLFDREEVYGKVRDAVIWMSRQKMGAIITFERKISLAKQMSSGTMVNAPISAELLQTIFFPGTRLHDGAVVIRDDMIAAAAVFYTPTTRPLTGKYGSRHRAAIGISEVSDAVTVVVSEETGRISIAYNGELSPVNPDHFLDTFMEFMSMESPDMEE
ncbi:MAG: DNA integrity scanning protein DisA nucleotide-binding domain protein [Candidatus Enteromonas sp.]|nr:DNA integrity scanning protein DisA nucleotide-binding domain protein [Candidatus Enteromonas sp.]